MFWLFIGKCHRIVLYFIKKNYAVIFSVCNCYNGQLFGAIYNTDIN